MESIRKNITQQVFLSEFTAAMQNGSSRFALWFYPETSAKGRKKITEALQEYVVGRETVQPVTLYGHKDPEPVEVSPLIFRLTTASIEKMITIYKDLVSSCDSVATYPRQHDSFAWAVVFHENEIFLQDINTKKK